MLVLYLLAFLFLENNSFSLNFSDRILTLCCVLLNFLVFGISLLFPGNLQTKEKIFISLKNLGFVPNKPGAIDFLSVSVFNHWQALEPNLISSNYYLYAVHLSLIFLAFFFVRGRLLNLLKNKNIKILLLFNFFIFLPVFILTVDWGRWLYIHAVALFILLTVTKPAENELSWQNLKFLNIVLGSMALFVYSQCWRLEHYAPRQIFVSRFNVTRFIDPFVTTSRKSRNDFLKLLIKQKKQ